MFGRPFPCHRGRGSRPASRGSKQALKSVENGNVGSLYVSKRDCDGIIRWVTARLASGYFLDGAVGEQFTLVKTKS